MGNDKMIETNKKGWNELIKSNVKFSNTIFPEYGPFLKRNEEEIKLFDKVYKAKILDLGCGEGESLEYLYKKGAREIWGVDISKEQIARAQKRFPQFKDNFFISAMEKEINLPQNHFDYVMSIFSIGYTSDLTSTFKNVYKYLNDNGAFIISWTHPFFYCLDVNLNNVIINRSYFNENLEKITKGPNKVSLMQYNLMISTLINTARENGFYVDKMLEEETVLKDDVNGYKSTFWKKEKVVNCPSTLIIKFKKINL